MTDMEVRGLVEASAEIRATRERAMQYSKWVVNHGAEEAKKVMEREIPKRRGPDRGGLASRLFVDEATYFPGGAGGGGRWVAHAGLRREENAWGHDLGEMILKGTGIYGPSKKKIRATDGGNLKNTFPMPGVLGGNSLIFRQSHEGMEAQTDWVREGQRAASVGTEVWFRRLNNYLSTRG